MHKPKLGVHKLYQLTSPKPVELSIADTIVLAIFSFLDLNAANINDIMYVVKGD